MAANPDALPRTGTMTIAGEIFTVSQAGTGGVDLWSEDFDFGTQQYRHVERCAFVSDKNWHKWMVKIMDPFTRRTEEKFFEPDQLGQAWDWVQDSS